MDKKIKILSCGVFQRELEELIKKEQLPFETSFTNSMLHMHPSKLEKVLEKEKSQLGEDRLLLLFGDCQPRMEEFSNQQKVTRVEGLNCCQIILGEKRYKRYQKERVFFLLPEWAVRWKEVFQKHLGFNQETARTFMKEMHSRLVYLDTQIDPIDYQLLDEIKAFCGIPLEVLPCGLDELKKSLIRSIEELKSE